MLRARAAARSRFIATILRAALAIGLIAALFYYDVITLDALRASFDSIGPAASAFTALLIGHALAAYAGTF